MAKFNMVEFLVPWIGDIAATGITQATARQLTKTQRFLCTGQGRIMQAITDEWRLAPSALELECFYREVDDIIQASKTLEARLDKLETSK